MFTLSSCDNISLHGSYRAIMIKLVELVGRAQAMKLKLSALSGLS